MSGTLTGTRVFDAPVDRVWTAWTDPADVRQWWGAAGFTVPVAEIDFRVGGTSLVCMSSPEYGRLYNTWQYQDIVPHERIEFLMRFTDEAGVPVDPQTLGIPPGVPKEVPHLVTFRALVDGRTEMSVTEYGYTSEQAVEISRIGLEHCLDKMTVLVSTGGSR